MPTPLDVQVNQSGSDVAAIDSHGNLTLAGNITPGGYLALAPQAKAPTQVPGELLLFTLDGVTLSSVNGAGAVAPVAGQVEALTAPLTITGTTAKTLALAGPTIPANGLTAGQTYRVVAWGTVSTTVDTQTITLEIDYGVTDVFTFGAQPPNSGATVTGAAWRFEADLIVDSPTSISASGWDGLNFFFSSLNQSVAAVTSTTAKAFTFQITPSDVAVSVTVNGAYFQRIA